METSTALSCQIRQYPYCLSPSASSPSPANLHHHSRRRLQNVRHQHKSTMPLRDLTLRRITTTQYHFRFNNPQEAFSITNHFTSVNHDTMSEESKNKVVEPEKVDPTTLNFSKSKEEKEKASEKSTPAIPPPPEKPLPGDCCGSGCVRCVWDVYYDELEEYNRLYKADSKTS
ncbi:hypothetical protein Pfo_018616 [Paulownia fortunei]|nr:hypothetical protein Pfo_018616 [Paulownia fortunei]